MTENTNPSHVTYYVAPPFVESEDGSSPGQAEECRTSTNWAPRPQTQTGADVLIENPAVAGPAG